MNTMPSQNGLLIRLYVVAVALSLASCGTTTSAQEKRSSPVSYGEVKKDPKGSVGKTIVWVGKAMEWKTTTDGTGKTRDTETYYIEPPPPSIDDYQWFVVDVTSPTKTALAEKLSRTSGDPGIRKISGTISGSETITVNVNRSPRQIQVPVVSSVTIDGPDQTATKR
jgi:hypothetical protein